MLGAETAHTGGMEGFRRQSGSAKGPARLPTVWCRGNNLPREPIRIKFSEKSVPPRNAFSPKPSFFRIVGISTAARFSYSKKCNYYSIISMYFPIYPNFVPVCAREFTLLEMLAYANLLCDRYSKLLPRHQAVGTKCRGLSSIC